MESYVVINVSQLLPKFNDYSAHPTSKAGIAVGLPAGFC
jgi:hypothetical protein